MDRGHVPEELSGMTDADENNMDRGHVPEELSGMTDAEQMLISRLARQCLYIC